MNVAGLITLTRANDGRPVQMAERLGKAAPPALYAVGPVAVLESTFWPAGR